MQKILVSFIIFLFSCFQVYGADVQTNVGKVQSLAPAYTVPVGYEEKGFVGSIISQIFDPVGKILSSYILAFQNIWNTDNTVPVWNSSTKVFDAGSIFDTGSKVGIGTSSLDSRFTIYGGGDITGVSDLTANLMLQDTGGRMMIDSNELQSVSSSNIARHIALQPFGGSVGIGRFPNSAGAVKLDVDGKMRMRNQTESSDNDNIVATKGYVDSAIASINFSGAFSIEDFTLLKEGIHTVTDCRDAGGVPVKGDGINGFTQDGQSFCKFSRSTCPSGWTNNGNWMKTLAGETVTARSHCSGTFCSRDRSASGRCEDCSWGASCQKSVSITAPSCSSTFCGTDYRQTRTSTCTVEKIGCY